VTKSHSSSLFNQRRNELAFRPALEHFREQYLLLRVTTPQYAHVHDFCCRLRRGCVELVMCAEQLRLQNFALLVILPQFEQEIIRLS